VKGGVSPDMVRQKTIKITQQLHRLSFLEAPVMPTFEAKI